MKHQLTQKVAAVLSTIALLSFSANLPARTIDYTYDAAGRLTAASYDTGARQIFAYDLSGNLLQSAVILPGTFTDSDGNGIDDDWELFYFGFIGIDPNGDADGDGFSNLHEFLAGTDPTDPNSLLRLLPDPQVSGSEVTVQWESVPGKTYRLQFTTDLASGEWTDIPGDVTASAAITSKLDATAPQAQRYYRVVLAQ